MGKSLIELQSTKADVLPAHKVNEWLSFISVFCSISNWLLASISIKENHLVALIRINHFQWIKSMPYYFQELMRFFVVAVWHSWCCCFKTQQGWFRFSCSWARCSLQIKGIWLIHFVKRKKLPMLLAVDSLTFGY